MFFPAGNRVPSWVVDAACAEVGGDDWFPEKGSVYDSQIAKRICRSCEVRRECLEYALANNEQYGIWGGVSPRDRRKLLSPDHPRRSPRP